MDDRPAPAADYHAVPAAGGMPAQTALLTGRAVFTEAWALIPRGVLRDITVSYLPGWRGTRAWVLARPMSGFAETFAQLKLHIAPGGGAARPEPEADAEAVVYVLSGTMILTLDGTAHALAAGGYVYVPPGTPWQVAVPKSAEGETRAIWIRKRWEPAEGLTPPAPVVAAADRTAPHPMPEGHEGWSTTRFVDPEDLRHDMHVNIVTLEPGRTIPFEETHVMEHGIYVLNGRGVYQVNRDWVEVEPGDFLWLRAFCPQSCYAGGPAPFRYLLYKDVNRHMPLAPPAG